MLLLTSLLILGTSTVSLHPATDDTLRWQELPEVFGEAARQRHPVLIYVQASWCGPCQRMDRDVFPEAAPLLHRFALARLDFDDHDAQIKVGALTQTPAAWARHFGAETPPTFVLLDPDGAILTRVTGFLDVHAFSLLLAYVATKAYRHATFEEYVHRTTTVP